jgi:hypothetical protein
MYKFNERGMIKFPNPLSRSKILAQENLLVIKECFCPNGHNLVSEKAWFCEFKGIVLGASNAEDKGLVALSPLYGVKSRISFGITLRTNELYDFYCPECGARMPAFSSCDCGGSIIAFFLNKEGNFSDCIGICNRLGCTHACIRLHNEIISAAALENL